MSWSIGYDKHWKRDVGYGVPTICDDPTCADEIDRGLSHVCGGEPYGGECGCGLYFCGKHLWYGESGQVCRRCRDGRDPFTPKLDTREWMLWKLQHPSWSDWRTENPDEVSRIEAALAALTPAESEAAALPPSP